jgi:putative phosphoribosyl transferase
MEKTVAVLNVHKRVYKAFPAFDDRFDAGRRLVEFLNRGPQQDKAVVLGLPRGGVPVGWALAQSMNAVFDVMIVRKLPLPGNPEAGFGAVATDGSTFLNEAMLEHFGLTPLVIESITEQVRRELRRRAREYRGTDQLPQVRGMDAYLVDDGLATGYTMLAAATMVKKLQPRSLTLCVPVSPWDSVGTVLPSFDEIYILFVQERTPFAVASFYRDFHDMADREVLEIIGQSKTCPRAKHD